MTKVVLENLSLTVDESEFGALVSKFALENQYEGSFLASDFPELVVRFPAQATDSHLTDAIDFIHFVSRHKLARALQAKYRIGNEFSEESKVEELYHKIFVTAENVAMANLGEGHYSLDLLVAVELYYWVILQCLRKARGERIDVRYRGNQERLGKNLDLASEELAALSSLFYLEND